MTATEEATTPPDLLKDAIENSPKESGEFYRGISQKRIDALRSAGDGAIVSDDGFLAVTGSLDQASKFGSETVKVRGQGASMEGASSAPNEKELLFRPGTKFEVSVGDDGGVTLTELTEGD